MSDCDRMELLELRARNDSLTAEVERLREALEAITNVKAWDNLSVLTGWCERGTIAHKALEVKP